MPLLSIDPRNSHDASQLRRFAEQLEAGAVLFFPQSPVAVAPEDTEFLLSQRQHEGGHHKNIAYRPKLDRVTNVAGASPEQIERLRAILSGYSRHVIAFLSKFLAAYREGWNLDFTTFRPVSEQGRKLPLRKRNDLLHVDSFSTRPTDGDRILRFFTNLNPSQSRDWITGGTFKDLASAYAVKAGSHLGKMAMPQPITPIRRARQAFGRLPVVRPIAPRLGRSPYDEFMMDFHNFLKESESYQRDCAKEEIQFPPGSSWMCYTDTVSHAVLRGQYAMEQTLIVKHSAMVEPEVSPLRILEVMAGGAMA